MRIITNFHRFPESWTSSDGQRGTAKVVRTAEEFLREAPAADLLIVNGDPAVTLKLASAFLLMPWKRRPIVAVDLVLRRPSPTLPGGVAAACKKLLFGRVDYFLHYFKDVREYERLFGIPAARSGFVDFKPNIRYTHEVEPNSDGEYVLCFGRSMRDYDTFFEAMELVPCPGAIPEPDFKGLNQHGSRFTRPLDRLPPNVRRLPDDGSSEALVRIISGAKLVVLPIVKWSLLAGIGTYLNAMYMKKCVVLSDGPGCSDVLTPEQVLFVPRGDARALAATIERAWEDGSLRERTAEAGYRYASSLGGEPELRQRIIDASMRWLRARGGAGAAAGHSA